MPRLRQSISLMLALACAAGIRIGAAADAPVTDSDAASSQGRLEVIIVTAQRREEALQDVPISVTALSADTRSWISTPRFPGLAYTGNRNYGTRDKGITSFSHVGLYSKNPQARYSNIFRSIIKNCSESIRAGRLSIAKHR